MSAKDVEGFYPLSPMQHGMLYHTLYAPESGSYVQQIFCTLKGELNVAAFEQAWQQVIDRYSVLRSAFLWEKLKGPIQLVQRQVKLPLEQQDWQHYSPQQQETELEALLVADRARGFELAQAPLMRLFLLRLGTHAHQFIWSHHHILFDGWSVPLMLQEWFAFYEAGCRGETLKLDQPYAFRNYIVWLKRQDTSKAEAYWRKALAGFTTPTRLSVERTTSDETGYGEEQVQLSLEQVQRFAREQQVTLNTVLQAAWALLLSRYSGEEDVLFGATVSGRPEELPGAQQMIGLFINSLPVRVHASREAQVGAWLRELQTQMMELRQYEFSPLVEVQGWSDVKRGQNLFETLVVFENYPMGESLNSKTQSLTLEHLRVREQNNFPLTLLSASDGILRLSYDRKVYDQETVKRLLGQLQTLLLAMVNEPSQQLRSLPLLTEAERQQLLVEWNATAHEYAEEQCVDRLFAAQVKRTSETPAVIFGEQQLSYAELERRANQLAHQLQQLGVGPDVKVGVFMERSLEMMIAVLGIVKAGGAYVPLDPNYPSDRVSYMLSDAAVEVLITQAALEDKLPAHGAQVLCWERDWAGIARQSETAPPWRVSADNLLYVIYTSGSTGQPKGVAMTHRGVYQLLSWQARNLDLQAWQRTLQMASLSFDVSFQEIFTTWCSGGTLVLLSEAERRDGSKLLSYLKTTGIERLFLPFVALQQLAELADEEWLQQLKLREVIASGEQLRITPPLVRFFSGLPDCVLYNQYGPSETHVVTSHRLTGAPASWPSLPPLGRVLDNSQTYILDRQLQPVPVGVVGELYLSGASLSRGYLNQPALTAARFLPNPFGAAGTRLYQTGDQAKYQRDGVIEYVGRADQQVKYRGYRIELGEIEAVLDQHPGVSEAVVMVRAGEDGGKRLVAYVVGEPGAVPINELREFLQARLPEYMVPGVFVALAELPLTPSGKVDRKALPEPDGSRPELEKEYVAPRTAVEEVLAGIWAAVLGVEKVGSDDNFFELGGHSLLATQVVSRVREAFRVELPLSDLFERATLGELAPVIEARLRGGSDLVEEPIKAARRNEALPLSFAQQRLWFLDQLEPGTATYNVPFGIRLSGQLDVGALERAISEVVRRHETLRTRFVEEDGTARQVIAEGAAVALPLIDLSSRPEAEQEAEVQRLAGIEGEQAFDLAQGQLWRVRLLRLRAAEHVLLFTMHHIVSDAWSMNILTREVSTLYSAYVAGREPALAELPIQYADYAVWQREWLQGEVLEGQLGYWRKQLAGAPAVLELPADRVRPAQQSHRGAQLPLQLPAELSAGLKQLSQREGVTLFMSLLAGWQLLLARYSRQPDVVVGSPVANRTRAEVEGLIGFFVNTLVLRTEVSGELRVRELLQRVREVCLGAYAHQEVPFEMLVEQLQPERDLSHTPLFQVMLTLQNAPQDWVDWAGVRIRPLELQSGISKFDMTLVLAESERGLAGTLEYNRDLYERESMERLLGHYQQLLSGLVENVEKPVSTLPWLSEGEREEVVLQSRGEERVWGASDVVELFEAQVSRVGSATAVVSEGEQISYEDLNRRANQLAHYLTEMGVGPEVKVGLLLRRSVAMVVGVLGVLKTGAAYLPLDIQAPLSRLAYMLEDAQVPLLITEENLPEGVPAHWGQTIYLDSDWEQISQQSEANPAVSVSAENLAYMIYTSGSSGRPKGALITRGGLSNYLSWALSTYPVSAGNGSAVHTPLSFDLTVTSLFTPLLSGKTVHLLREAAGAEALVEALQSGASYSLVKLTPSHLEVLRQQLTAEQAADCSQALVIGGEALYEEQVRWWREQAHAVRLYNEYGPTETVVGCCVAEVGSEGNGGVVSIGRPISNTQLYVLDERMQVVPVGLVGEIYIGGAGVGGGYWERAELTAERYLPNPFSEHGGERLYRSGDAGRYQRDGQVEYVGRLDEQVKVRGYRVELGEIEAELREQGTVREAVVMLREDQAGSKRLVAYVVAEAESKVSVSELRESLQERLPEYMIPAAFVVLEELPLTVNGKVDRRALPAPDSQRPELEKVYVAPRNQREAKLAGIWSQVLGMDQVGIHDNFFELGGDSIRSIQVVARARQHGLAITTRQLFQYQTIAELADAVTEQENGEVFGPVPLTPIQHWFFEQGLTEPQHFSQSVLLSLPQTVDATLLEELVAALLRHHDALRLRFTHSAEGWRQEIARFDADEAVPLTVLDLAHLSDAELETAIETETTRVQSSLNPSAGPLLRVVLFELGAGRGARLLLVIHHLAVDEVSWRILLEDLQRGYEQLARGERVEFGAKTTSYQEWAVSLQSAALQTQLNYWEQMCQQPVSSLLPPAEHQSPAAVQQVLSEAETRELLEDVPEIYHTETQEVLLTALAETLSRWSGTPRVKINVEGNGRDVLQTGMDLSRTVGCFTNIYPIVLETPAEAGTGDRLKQIKEQVRAVPQNGIGYGVLRYLTQTLSAGQEAEISFNYQQQLGHADDAFSAGEIRGREGKRHYGIEVRASVIGGKLQVSWTFNHEQVEAAEMERVAEWYMEELREIIQHCAEPAAGGYTPSDVVDFAWSQQDLDKIVAQISGSMVAA